MSKYRRRSSKRKHSKRAKRPLTHRGGRRM